MKTPTQWLTDLKSVLDATQCKVEGKSTNLETAMAQFKSLLQNVRAKGNTVWWVGNGGSSAIASHLSQDLINKLHLRSSVLTDASLLTCMANDYGYENIYCQPLETLCRKGDLLIAISSSGKSKNILNCAELSLKMQMSLVTLSAFSDSNPLWNHPSQVAFFLNSNLYGLVELSHEALLHAAIETLWLQEKAAST